MFIYTKLSWEALGPYLYNPTDHGRKCVWSINRCTSLKDNSSLLSLFNQPGDQLIRHSHYNGLPWEYFKKENSPGNSVFLHEHVFPFLYWAWWVSQEQSQRRTGFLLHLLQNKLDHKLAYRLWPGWPTPMPCPSEAVLSPPLKLLY